MPRCTSPSSRQRTHKITATGTTVFLYDLSGQLLEEASYSLAGQQQSSQFYIWLDNLPLGGITVTYDTSGGIASSEPFFLHFDHLGTPRVATNAGQTVWAWNSDAFGAGATSGSLTINLRFPGQYYDQESGLHYNYFRDYDPETGRYVESDPIGLGGGLNTYGYAYQNPINNFDPDGRAVWFLLLGGFGGGAGATTTGTGVLLTGTALTGTALIGTSVLMTGSTPAGSAGAALGAGSGTGDPQCPPNDPFCQNQTQSQWCEANLPKNIHTGAQGKHIPGHNNFIAGRSPLNANPQQLLQGVHSGQYQIVRLTPKGQPVVNFGKNIGTHAGTGQTTNYGIIHTSKHGAHIVPANPSQVLLP